MDSSAPIRGRSGRWEGYWTRSNCVAIRFRLVTSGRRFPDPAAAVVMATGGKGSAGELAEQVVQPVERLNRGRRVVEGLGDRPFGNVEELAEPVRRILGVAAFRTDQPQASRLVPVEVSRITVYLKQGAPRGTKSPITGTSARTQSARAAAATRRCTNRITATTQPSTRVQQT